MTRRMRAVGSVLALLLGLSGCSAVPGFNFFAASQDMPLPKGPPIVDVVTPFDRALDCIRGKIDPSISFAVGQVIDATGKEAYADGGSGKLLSQGAGEMVQTALFRSGVTVVNRRDPNILVVETQWGIRDIKQQTPANFYVSGSINSLDFIPGEGFEVDVAGFGVRTRQTRILVALDLSLTDAFTGRIVANVPLQKQIFTRETGYGTDRFFDTTLVSLAAGGMEREAVHFAMRQMLNFATLELIGQLIPEQKYAECRSIVAPTDGTLSESIQRRSEDLSGYLTEALRRNREAPLQTVAAQQQPQQQQQQVAQAAPKPAAAPVMTPQLRANMERATTSAGRALVAAQASLNASDIVEAKDLSKEAIQFLAVAMQSLKVAAGMGLSGAEGDAVALLVEQAISNVQSAQVAVQRREAAIANVMPDPATPAAPAPAPAPGPRTRIDGSRDAVRNPEGVE